MLAATWFGHDVPSPLPLHGGSMSTSASPLRTGNRLLDRLPEDEFKRLQPSSEPISLPQGYELCKQDGAMSHAYFPTGGVCSVVSVTEDAKVVETGTVG